MKGGEGCGRRALGEELIGKVAWIDGGGGCSEGGLWMREVRGGRGRDSGREVVWKSGVGV